MGVKEAKHSGVEDVDFSGVVKSHSDWGKHSDTILQALALNGTVTEGV